MRAATWPSVPATAGAHAEWLAEAALLLVLVDPHAARQLARTALT
jgi:hypothetical protein